MRRQAFMSSLFAALLAVFWTIAFGHCHDGPAIYATPIAGTSAGPHGVESRQPNTLVSHRNETVPDPKSKGPSQPGKGGLNRTARPWTELMQAAADGDYKTLLRLLGKGEDPNVRSSNKWTPLLWACANGRADMVRLLLKHGARMDVCGRFLYSYPDEGGGYVGCFVPLKIAAHNGHVRVVRVLMQHVKKPPRWSTQVADSLLVAAEKRRPAVVKELLDLGADVNAQTSMQAVQGSPALLAAVGIGHPGMVELLLRHGADPNSYEHPQGDTIYQPMALDIATQKGNERIRQLLLRYGAAYFKLPSPYLP